MKNPSFLIPILFVSFFSSTTSLLFAQTSLEVSGILSGRDSMAIVNGETVQKGSRIQEFTVVDIGPDFVKFASASGESIIKKVGEKEPGAILDEAVPLPVPVAVVEDPDREAVVKQYAAQAAKDIDAAEILLRSQGAPNPAAYKQAISLYGKAERVLQLAVEKAAVDSEARVTVKTAIDGVRDISRNLAKAKRELEEKIKTALEGRKVVMGKTKDEVIKSIGRPVSVSTSNDRNYVQEQWTYGDPSRKATYLYFVNGILSSYQY